MQNIKDKSKDTVRIPVYDFTRDDRSDEGLDVTVPPLTILVGAQSAGIRELVSVVDMSAIIDTPDEVRLSRRLKRDTIERGRTIESVVDQFSQMDRPAVIRHLKPYMDQADLIVSDTWRRTLDLSRHPEAVLRRSASQIFDYLIDAEVVETV